MWLISAPLLGAQYYGKDTPLGIIDFAGIAIWIIGFTFEAGGDIQLALFKADPANKGKVLNKGFWHYTRHPNYFGDSAVWWGYGLICLCFRKLSSCSWITADDSLDNQSFRSCTP